MLELFRNLRSFDHFLGAFITLFMMVLMFGAGVSLIFFSADGANKILGVLAVGCAVWGFLYTARRIKKNFFPERPVTVTCPACQKETVVLKSQTANNVVECPRCKVRIDV